MKPQTETRVQSNRLTKGEMYCHGMSMRNETGTYQSTHVENTLHNTVFPKYSVHSDQVLIDDDRSLAPQPPANSALYGTVFTQSFRTLPHVMALQVVSKTLPFLPGLSVSHRDPSHFDHQDFIRCAQASSHGAAKASSYISMDMSCKDKRKFGRPEENVCTSSPS